MPDAGGTTAIPGTGATIPVIVLGGTGYVAGELLRLLATHPTFRVAAAVSTSEAGGAVTAAFPHLGGTSLDPLRFSTRDDAARLFERGRRVAIAAATPHGATAALLDGLLTAAEAAGADAHAVDGSADFRFPDPARYEAIYGVPHGAPARLPQFACCVPEHQRGPRPLHAAQPGCFTTSVVLPVFPLLQLGLVEPDVFASCITGSSGAGRTPTSGTHHPERRSALYAYAPLAHRHEAEMRRLLGAACGGAEPEVAFVPHSGPFVRGIHATLRLTLTRPLAAAEVADAIDGFYGAGSFVHATTAPPRLNEVTGTNRCRIGVATRGTTLVVTSVIDNLVKGAAGGVVQWLNLLFGLPFDAGLRLPGLGWS